MNTLIKVTKDEFYKTIGPMDGVYSTIVSVRWDPIKGYKHEWRNRNRELIGVSQSGNGYSTESEYWLVK